MKNSYIFSIASLLALMSGCNRVVTQAPALLQTSAPDAPTPKAAGMAVSPLLIVDQFGWRANTPRKVALIADPQHGQNVGEGQHIAPGDTFVIRRVSDNKTVYTGKTIAWHNGQEHTVSGDKVWACDFSALKTPGRYVLVDPKNNRQSFPFTVGDDLYNPVLQASVRVFFYQRCGYNIDPKQGGNWSHTACHLGPDQDHAAQLYIDKPEGQPGDVSGGWHDAGDDNKYVPFLTATMWDLLTAYEINPRAFGDHTNIPESGNGVPDILDEAKYEIDWLLKMQNADGSVCNRVAAKSYDNGKGPVEDTQPRYRTQSTTWATAVFAATTAHAARLFAPFNAGYAKQLRQAAERAWAYLEAHGQMLPASGTDGAKMAAAGGDSNPHGDKRLRILAAAQLFRTTGEPRYNTYFKANYRDKANTEEGNHHPLVDGYFDATQTTDLNRAFVTYAQARGADLRIVQEIKTALKNTMENTLVPNYVKNEDPYRAYIYDGHYSWGSNMNKATWANLALYAITLNANPSRNALYREIAEEYLHYFHGRNPLGWVYLSNMGAKGANLGASKSVMEIYHHWFQDGSPLYDGANSRFGPAPGYLAGGPNSYFTKTWVSPPHGEPPMKAYRDWNAAWNAERKDGENSWEVTEPAIYYQAAYTLLVAYFATPTRR